MELTLHLDHDCNLRCRYCYAGQKFASPMPLEVARRAVELALGAGQGALGLTFFGGEPLLAWDRLVEVTGFARERCLDRRLPFIFRLATNGTLLDEAKVAFLEANRFGIQLSLDGIPEAHDRNRCGPDGAGSYGRALDGLARLLVAGLEPVVVAVVDPSNVELLPDSIAHLGGLGVRQIQLAPNPLASWDERACETFEKQLRRVGDWWAAQVRASHGLRLEPFDSLVERHVRRERTADCDFGLELAVAPSGRLYPCDRLVMEDRDEAVCIGDVWTGIDEAKRAACVAAARNTDKECASCEHEARCNYGCACAAYTLLGRFGAVSPVFCWLQRCFIREADHAAEGLWTERAPAFLARFGLAARE